MLIRMPEVVWLLLTTAQPATRAHQNLVLENLLLRHQLAVLTGPTRCRSQARLRLWDKLLWVLARRFCAGWGEHLSFVTPETVVRWHSCAGIGTAVAYSGVGSCALVAAVRISPPRYKT